MGLHVSNLEQLYDNTMISKTSGYTFFNTANACHIFLVADQLLGFGYIYNPCSELLI